MLYVDQTGALGGAQIALRVTAHHLSEDVDPHFLLFQDGPIATQIRELGRPVVVLNGGSTMASPVVGASPLGLLRYATENLLSIARIVLRTRRLVRELRPDVVHTNSMKAHVLASVALIAFHSRPMLVCHVRDRLSREYMSFPVRLVAKSVLVLCADEVIANSEHTLDTLPRRFHRQDRAYVMLSPIELPDPAMPRARERAGLRVLLLSRLAPWKGQLEFVELVPKLLKCDRALSVTIAGAAQFGEDDYAARLAARVGELGLESVVSLVGHVDDVYALLVESDILVHCSLLPEPLGQVVMQGMAAGVAVVAAAAGGPLELIRDRSSGLLYDMGDDDALVSAVQELIADPDLRTRLGEAARIEADRFGAEAVIPALERQYRTWLPQYARLRSHRLARLRRRLSHRNSGYSV